MISIPHSLKFVTEVDENSPLGMRVANLSPAEQIEMLEGMLKELVAPMFKPVLDEINAGSSWAVLKVAE